VRPSEVKATEKTAVTPAEWRDRPATEARELRSDSVVPYIHSPLQTALGGARSFRSRKRIEDGCVRVLFSSLARCIYRHLELVVNSPGADLPFRVHQLHPEQWGL